MKKRTSNRNATVTMITANFDLRVARGGGGLVVATNTRELTDETSSSSDTSGGPGTGGGIGTGGM